MERGRDGKGEGGEGTLGKWGGRKKMGEQGKGRQWGGPKPPIGGRPGGYVLDAAYSA